MERGRRKWEGEGGGRGGSGKGEEEVCGGRISDLAVKVSMRSHHDSGKVANYKTCRKYIES